ncbi:hypothetical protein [Caloramator sp. Dgby_cultured_2]|uniref:hypothetical protein n=1 Tax=Caloramator sp. Dgby_cultured_2 TaxID=3029174 RepID=UPI00237EA787|nr:hypothetical protein [Caloramator sp. Dgby_cultured_2]WDU84287.1 hypothetical protein PWK10_08305 [Caloramator sp. Dgby_cultured_2]
MTTKFGPSGISDSFYEDGYKSSIDYPMWLNKMGLELYEYSFGRGINLKEETAIKIGENSKNMVFNYLFMHHIILTLQAKMKILSKNQ